MKILGIVVVFGILAGMSGSAMMLGWIWPSVEPSAWVSQYTRPGFSKDQLEDRVASEAVSKILSVHRGTIGSGAVNSLSKKIGDALVIGSDGWLALYFPSYAGDFKNLNALSSSGTVFQPVSAVFDKYTGILYLKLDSGQFKIFGFGNDLANLDDVFVYQDYWRHAVVVNREYSAISMPHLDASPILAFELDQQFAPGSIAINNQGRIVGLISGRGLLLPSAYITNVMPQVLSKKTISYLSLAVEGWFSDEQPIIRQDEKIGGFMVAKVLNQGNLIKKGDVILEIEGRVVTPENLWYNILNNKTFKTKVLRNGKEIELELKTSEINL